VKRTSRSLKKLIKENFRRWKDLPYSWTNRINTYQKQSTDATQSTSKLKHNSSKTWKEQFSISYRQVKNNPG
jgi:gas vesicle protein